MHSQSWPSGAVLENAGSDDAAMLAPVGEVLGLVRRAKTEGKASQKAAVSLLVVRAPAQVCAAIANAEADLRDAGSIALVTYEPADVLTCVVTLARSD